MVTIVLISFCISVTDCSLASSTGDGQRREELLPGHPETDQEKSRRVQALPLGALRRLHGLARLPATDGPVEAALSLYRTIGHFLRQDETGWRQKRRLISRSTPTESSGRRFHPPAVLPFHTSYLIFYTLLQKFPTSCSECFTELTVVFSKYAWMCQLNSLESKEQQQSHVTSLPAVRTPLIQTSSPCNRKQVAPPPPALGRMGEEQSWCLTVWGVFTSEGCGQRVRSRQ